MAEVESFTLDHTKVKAPYVRLIAQEQGVKGDVIANYDLRFLQPNEKELPTGVVHTFEHLLADLLRDRIEGIIDISPFGCHRFPLNYLGCAKFEGSRSSFDRSLNDYCL